MSFIPKKLQKKLRDKKSEVTEKSIEDYLIERVQALHGVCWKLIGFSFNGFPDRTVMLPGGQVFFVELKRPGKSSRPDQEYIQKRLRELGFRVWVIDSKEKIDSIVNDLQRERAK